MRCRCDALLCCSARHYAVSLTPTITLMCNFWDELNLSGLHGCFGSQVSRAFDQARKEAVAEEVAAGRTASILTAAAAASSEEETFPAPVPYRVAHAPFVYLREIPSTEASMLATARTGEVLLMGGRRDGWLRTSAPVDGRDCCGWALEHGAALRLGVLLQRVDNGASLGARAEGDTHESSHRSGATLGARTPPSHRASG